MNLRQKIKKAKAELNGLLKEHHSSTWEIIKSFEKRQKLQKIINHKRNFNRYFDFNEEYKINLKKITYISFHADFKDLGVLKSPNGKPLKQKEINAFLIKMIQTKLYEHAKKVSEEVPSKDGFMNRIDYWISISDDRTKAKRLHAEKVYFQFKGDETIYRYQKQIDEKEGE